MTRRGSAAPAVAAALLLSAVAAVAADQAAPQGDAPRVIRIEASSVDPLRPTVERSQLEVQGADLDHWPELRYAPDATDAEPGEPSDDSVIPEDADRVLPETLDYWEHRQQLADASIIPGQPVGGTALVGVRLAPASAAGRVQATEGDPVLTALSKWDGIGAFVLEVVTGSPADDAGLQPGDVIVQYGGTWVDTQQLFVELASRSVVGRERETWFLRGDAVQKTWIVPRERAEVERP